MACKPLQLSQSIIQAVPLERVEREGQESWTSVLSLLSTSILFQVETALSRGHRLYCYLHSQPRGPMASKSQRQRYERQAGSAPTTSLGRALVVLRPQNTCTRSRLKNDIVNSSLGSNLCHHSKGKIASHPCIFPLDQCLSTQLAEEAFCPSGSKEFTKIKGKLDADAFFN